VAFPVPSFIPRSILGSALDFCLIPPHIVFWPTSRPSAIGAVYLETHLIVLYIGESRPAYCLLFRGARHPIV